MSYKIHNNGDIRCIRIPARNLSSGIAPNVEVRFDIPSGLVVHTFIPQVGTWDKATKIWKVGDLAATKSVFADMCLKVTDISRQPFYVKRFISVNGSDSSTPNNTYVDIFAYETLSPLSPTNKSCAALCGDVNDDCEGVCPLGKGKRYQLIEDSLVNAEVTFDITGKYSVFPIYPTLGWEFKYYVFCENCEGESEGPYGPVKVSGPASYQFLPCNEVNSCIDWSQIPCSVITACGAGGGSVPHTLVNVTTTTYTVTATSGTVLILVDAQAAGGTVTITLNTAFGNTALITIKKKDSGLNQVITNAFGSETIDSSLTQTILFQNTAFTVKSDNSNWWRVS